VRNSDVKYIHFNSSTLSRRAVTICSSETRCALFEHTTALSASEIYKLCSSSNDDDDGGGGISSSSNNVNNNNREKKENYTPAGKPTNTTSYKQ